MEANALSALLERQKAFFATGGTLPIANRKAALRILYDTIKEHERDICDALYKDLGKPEGESYMCEIGLTLAEIRYMLRHLSRFAKDKRVRGSFSQFPSRSFVRPAPFGSVLVMSPWNYPFLLSVEPVVDALAAGNTVMLKPSAYSPATSALLKRLFEECFLPELVSVVEGGRAENTALLHMDFDMIFFTGSKEVGREVMKAAAEHLVPIVLELGGKSPCIVDESADITLTARRIVFGKLINCGQTCVAPDYILCDAKVKDALIEALKLEMRAQIGEKPLENPQWGKIVSEKHFRRVLGLIDPAKVQLGGGYDEKTHQIEPTILVDVTPEDAVMGEEIFGPILPVLTYETPEEALAFVRERPAPLALYVFSRDKESIHTFINGISFGGGCINDTIVHLATSEMAFGGVGESGMGSYHGKRGFDAFTHEKSILDKKLWLDLPMRYRPYTEKKTRTVRRFLK